jgi:hypothetical protein
MVDYLSFLLLLFTHAKIPDTDLLVRVSGDGILPLLAAPILARVSGDGFLFADDIFARVSGDTMCPILAADNFSIEVDEFEVCE